MKTASLLLITINVASMCDLQVQVYSDVDYTVWTQFTFANKTKGKMQEIRDSGANQTRYTHISSANCEEGPTVLKGYRRDPSGRIVFYGETSAYLDGDGFVDYTFFDITGPRMGLRTGVTCGFGDCGIRG
ncbi:hypothetical protein Q1695_005316 [Nippostrongylus brasiliensis]|nr:hypothetical protein Q1695_005316 [Nippostrongylus brasiliensis]